MTIAAIYALYLVAFVLLDRASYIFPMAVFNVTPWNPQASLAIALVMFLGQRAIWVVFLALFAAEHLNRGTATDSMTAILVAVVLSLGYAAIAAFLRDRYPVAPALQRREEVVRLVVVITLGSLFTGLIYVSAVALALRHVTGILEAWLRFWIGDTVGVVVTLPLLLMIFDEDRRQQISRLFRERLAILQWGAVAMSLMVVFSLPELQRFKFFYLLFLPLVWIAARSGMAGTAPAMVLLQVGVVIGVHTTGMASLTVFELQTLLLALAITGFFVAVMVDERQRISDDLRRTLKLAAAGEMAAAVTHELKQPLTAMTNYANACKSMVEQLPGGAPPLVTTTLERVSAEARRAGDVVRRLRDLFRGGVPERDRVDLSQLVRQVISVFTERQPGTRIVVEKEGDDFTADIDRLQVELVLRNLLQNAVEATDKDSAAPVIVRLRKGRDTIRIEVNDAGPGIPEARLERIFEPFVTDKPTGMGVGLSMSRTIIEAHGGKLSAESGPGGRFYFTLPCAGTLRK